MDNKNIKEKNIEFKDILILCLLTLVIVGIVLGVYYHNKNKLKINNLEKDRQRLLNTIEVMGDRENKLKEELELYKNK